MQTRRAFALSACGALACCHAPADAPLREPWRRLADAPSAVQEIYPTLHAGALWIAGGFSPQALGATRRVIAMDVRDNSWREGPRLPARAHHVHLASLDGALYAIGGFLGGATHL